MRRPDRETVLRLLAANGQAVTYSEPHLIEDVDGIPLAVKVETETLTLVVSPEALGWTWEELGVDPC